MDLDSGFASWYHTVLFRQSLHLLLMRIAMGISLVANEFDLTLPSEGRTMPDRVVDTDECMQVGSYVFVVTSTIPHAWFGLRQLIVYARKSYLNKVSAVVVAANTIVLVGHQRKCDCGTLKRHVH